MPEIPLEDCNVQNIKARCGTLQVYEDRLNRTGRHISLRVVLVPAQADWAVKPDALFFFAGGPGGSVIDQVGYYTSMFGYAHMDRDLVFVEQRGTGQSHPLICPPYDPKLTFDEYVKQCQASLNGDPRFYTTAMSVDDFDEARQVLGYDQIDLIGASYGGTVVQVYLQRHEDHVRSAIIDHSTLLRIPFMSVLPRSSQIGMDNLFTRCEKDAECQAAYPDLRNEFKELLMRVARQPAITEVLNPLTSKPIVFDQSDLAATIHNVLFNTSTAMSLPRLIHDAYTIGDFSDFAQIAIKLNQSSGTNTDELLMHQEIMCFEPWAAGTVAGMMEFGKGSYYLNVALNNLQSHACNYLPKPPAEALYGPQSGSNAPILVLVGEIDDQNPLENMAAAQELWPNAQIFVEPGQGHAYTVTQCKIDLVNAFIANPTKALDTSCLKDSAPPFEIRK
jgi:pimeloyl-ACP methyl ester carboxylesterase